MHALVSVANAYDRVLVEVAALLEAMTCSGHALFQAVPESDDSARVLE
jgi:hypothetical protein